MYAIKKGTTDLYVLGMLYAGTGTARKDDDHSPSLERCFLVWPAIKRTLNEYGQGGAKFRLAGIDPTAIVEEDISTFDFETYCGLAEDEGSLQTVT